MKILFFTYDLPFPLNSGGKIRAYYLLKSLSQRHQLTLFSFYRKEEQKKYLPEIKKFCPEIHLFWRRPAWSWQNLCRWFFSSLPFASATYYSRVLAQKLAQKLEQEKYDWVHFESFYPALYLPSVKKRGIKTVMGNENLEYLVYQRYAEQKPIPFRQLLKLEVWKMRLYEERLWRLADVNLAISAKDAVEIEKVTGRKCPVIPHGIDFDFFQPLKIRQIPQSIIFIGTLIYQANQDAVRFFLDQIYPLIKKKIPKVKFILVSWHKPKWLDKYLSDDSIEFIADKKTPAIKFLAKAEVLVSPKRVASGINIKILEAMAVGLPVVSTSVGLEGIEARANEEVVVADKAESFALEVIKLLTDKQKAQKIGQKGKQLIRKRYDWKKIAQDLETVFQGTTQ